MEPYVSDQPLIEDKKKKKKKQTSDDPYVEGVEMTEKKKSKSKSKASKSSKTGSGSGAVYSGISVAEESGWVPLNVKQINEDHARNPESGFHYAITGAESQVVTVAIPPGETCQGEPGSMMYLSSQVGMSVSCGGEGFTRCMAGESCCMLSFTNKSDSGETAFAGLTTNQPLAKVIPIDLNHPAVHGSLIVQQGAYMASYGNVNITFDCDCNLLRCFCGGMGLVRQNLKGNGTAFLGATGTIVQKVLAPDEVMLCDTNCILAYAESCKFDLKRAGGLLGMIGGGEGIFNSSIKGPGLVVVQSMNIVALLECLAADKIYRR